jgi:hypothetical protein
MTGACYYNRTGCRGRSFYKQQWHRPGETVGCKLSCTVASAAPCPAEWVSGTEIAKCMHCIMLSFAQIRLLIIHSTSSYLFVPGSQLFIHQAPKLTRHALLSTRQHCRRTTPAAAAAAGTACCCSRNSCSLGCCARCCCCYRRRSSCGNH